MSLVSEEYGAANVTLIMEWTHLAIVGAVYHVNILPSLTSAITIISTNSYRLTIPYNSDYNLSVEATVPQCRPKFNTTTFISLNYGEVYVEHNNCQGINTLYYKILQPIVDIQSCC